MAAKQAIFLIALAIVLLLGFSAVDAGYTNAGAAHNVTNESWTADPGNWTTLANSNLDGASYRNDETVYDENNTVMEEGTDYEWNNTDGTVKALPNGSLSDGESANISYTYVTFSQQQQGFMAVFAGVMDPSTALLIALAVAVIIAGMRFAAGV